MIANFDRFNKLEPPQLTLCNPHCRYDETGMLTAPVGLLVSPSDYEIIDNFNELSELNFTITKGAGVPDSTYSAIANRRTVFAEGIGFFIINSVEEHESDEGLYKSVGCVSCEAELENRLMPYIADGEYTLENMTNLIMEGVTNWQFMAYASTAPVAIKKTRVFEDADTDSDILSYMIDELQDKYGVLFIFDTVNRKIYVYDQDNYTQPSAVQLSTRDVLESVEIKENSEDIYTCLNVVGGGDLNILPVNPLGTNRIYNFAHYKSWMSEDLEARLAQWEDDLAAQHIEPDDELQLSTDAYVVKDNNTWYVAWDTQDGGTPTHHQVALSTVKYPKVNQLYSQVSEKMANLQLDIDNANELAELYGKCLQNVIAESSQYNACTGAVVDSYNEVLPEDEQIVIAVTAQAVQDTLDKLDGYIADEQAIIDDPAATADEKTAATARKTVYTTCRTNVANARTSQETDPIPTYGNNVQGYLNQCNDSVGTLGGQEIGIAADIESLKRTLNDKITEQQTTITSKTAQINGATGLQAQAGALDERAREISTSLSFSEFGAELSAELEGYIYQATYTNESITITDSMTADKRFMQSLDLYNDAIDELSVVCHPSQEFSIDAEFFVGLVDYKPVTDRVEVGRYLISVELYDGEIADLFLTSISVNYDDGSMSLTFGNRYNKYDNRTLYGDLFSNIQKTAADIRNLQAATYPVTHGQLTALTTAIRDAREVTKLSSITADNQLVTIDDTGYTARRNIGSDAFSPEQLKIVNNAIVMTKDNWNSALTAVGKMAFGGNTTYGINAEAVVGELLVGDNLALNVDEKDISTWIAELQAGVVNASQYQQYMTFTPADGLEIRQTPADGTSDGAPLFFTRQKGDGYYFYRSSDENTPFMSITSIDGKMHVNIMEVTDRLSIGSDAYGGYFDAIATDAGLAIKWRSTEQVSQNGG